jgi:hypothetical protein
MTLEKKKMYPGKKWVEEQRYLRRGKQKLKRLAQGTGSSKNRASETLIQYPKARRVVTNKLGGVIQIFRGEYSFVAKSQANTERKLTENPEYYTNKMKRGLLS